MRRAILYIAAMGLGYCASPAPAVVLFPGDAGVPAGSRPNDAVVGQFSGASAVAIAPNYILTVNHSGGGVGSTAILGGISYTVTQSVPIGNADLQVDQIANSATLLPANLTQYTPIYTNTNEVGQQVIIGGFGDGAGAAIYSGSEVVGYQWDGVHGVERWGANTVMSIEGGVQAQYLPYSSVALESYFYPQTSPNWIAHEGAVADGDSGGGWFIFDSISGQYEVVGINAYVSTGGASYFAPTPDENYAIQVAYYADSIDAAIGISAAPEPAGLSLMALSAVGLLLRRRRRLAGN